MGCTVAPTVLLTATGFVNGKWQFSTPYRIEIPQRITKNLSQVTASATSTAVLNAVQCTEALLGDGCNINLFHSDYYQQHTHTHI